MKFPSEEIVEWVRKDYPVGTRVQLREMNDPYAPPIGTFGTVIGVDDTASIEVSWDNGSHLNVVYGVDKADKVLVTTVCYNQKQEWTSRKEAIEFFRQGVVECDTGSSECSRYMKILTDLLMGKSVCTDEEDESD